LRVQPAASEPSLAGSTQLDADIMNGIISSERATWVFDDGATGLDDGGLVVTQALPNESADEYAAREAAEIISSAR